MSPLGVMALSAFILLLLLGVVGGPIMPLSQMLLLRIFPKKDATLATVIWAMTTLVGPVAGPLVLRVCVLFPWNLSARASSMSSRWAAPVVEGGQRRKWLCLWL